MSRYSDFFNIDGTRKDRDWPWRDCPAVEAFEKAVLARAKQYEAETHIKAQGGTVRMRKDLTVLAALAFAPNVDQRCMAEYLGHMLTVAIVQDLIVNRAVPAYNRIVPLANKGAKFSTGGKERAGSVRRAVRKFLKGKPEASAAAVWAGLKRKPPKGMTFFETHHLGWYVEKAGERETKYPRFCNIVSEEKKALLASK